MKKLNNDLGHTREPFLMERGERSVATEKGKKVVKRKKGTVNKTQRSVSNGKSTN